MTIVFVCGDPVVNASFLLLLYSDTQLPQLRYVRDILQPHVLPPIQRHPRASFQQDDARSHTARVSQDCLRTATIFPWSSRSPDLSAIEHIWDHLGRRVGHLTSLNELEARLQQIWNEMSQDIIQNLYASMPDRIASCIRARGGSTRRSPQNVLAVHGSIAIDLMPTPALSSSVRFLSLFEKGVVVSKYRDHDKCKNRAAHTFEIPREI
ncbi:transposable element Tcb1 transposase [Trichonephila clavipes]|nr:transposable element Tcb1 transposase [Trichonephila clavipes]